MRSQLSETKRAGPLCLELFVFNTWLSATFASLCHFSFTPCVYMAGRAGDGGGQGCVRQGEGDRRQASRARPQPLRRPPVKLRHTTCPLSPSARRTLSHGPHVSVRAGSRAPSHAKPQPENRAPLLIYAASLLDLHAGG